MSKKEPSHDAPPRLHSMLSIALVFGIALIFRFSYLHQIQSIGFFEQTISDARVYQMRARGIANGDWLGPAGFVHAPLYAYFLAIFQTISPENLYPPRAAQAILGAAGCAVLAVAARRWFDARVGLLTGLILAVYPPAIFFDGLIQKTSLGVFLCACLLWAMAAHRERRSFLQTALVGLLLGLLILVQQSLILLIPVVLVFLWGRAGRGRSAPPLVALLVLSTVMLPWAVRNKIVTGDFTLTTPNLGQNFAMGNHPDGGGTYMPFKHARSGGEFEQLEWERAAEKTEGRSLSPREVSDHYLRAAFQQIREQPVRWLRLVGRKGLMTVNAYEWPDTEDYYLYQRHSSLLAALDQFFHFGVLAPLAGVGIVLIGPRRREVWPLLAWWCVAAFGLVAFVVFGRYRFAMLPVMAMFAAAGLLQVLHCLKTRSHGRLARGALALIAGGIVANLPLGPDRRPGAIACFNHATVLLAADRLDEARSEIDAALDRDPASIEAHLVLAAILRKQGRLDDSLSACLRAAATDPSDGAGHRCAASTLVEMNRLDDAASHWRRALAIDERDQLARAGLATVMARRGHTGEAIALFEEALAEEPHNPEGKVNFGNVLLDLGRLDDAERMYRSALEDEPGFVDALYNLALLSLNRDRPEQALRDIERYLELRPDAEQAQIVRLTILLRLGLVEQARSEAERLLAGDPARVDLRRFLMEIKKIPRTADNPTVRE